MSEHDILVPVILSGGTGSRLWPLSRESHPKQFITLSDGQSLLQKTISRACHFSNAAELIVLTNKTYYLKTKADCDKATTNTPITFLLEPFANNTAPAIALAALKVYASYGPHALLLVLPADHLIKDIPSFVENCTEGFSLAKDNKIVTFGITPTYPETGFGYIESEEPYLDEKWRKVRRFTEKPNSALAETYFKNKKYLWNSGIFCFKASMILEELTQHATNLLAVAKQCWQISQEKNTHSAVFEFDPDSFAKFDNISIDYALLEKSQDIAVVICDFDWQDIGSWEAYKKLHSSDQNHNTLLGEALLIDSHDNFIYSKDRIIAAIGINNLAIVDTPDALLVTHRHRVQEVKAVVQTLKENAHESYLTHRTVIRPWGYYTVLEEAPTFKIKRIVVKSNASLSLQSHQYRSEHWVVIEGVAKVTNAGKEYLLKSNESTFVPKGTLHRLANVGDCDLIIIEVQTGNYLGEDDIVRFEDTYGR